MGGNDKMNIMTSNTVCARRRALIPKTPRMDMAKNLAKESIKGVKIFTLFKINNRAYVYKYDNL